MWKVFPGLELGFILTNSKDIDPHATAHMYFEAFYMWRKSVR